MDIAIVSDDYYKECINLAKKSKGKERYGSILVKDGNVIGAGFNRAIAHKYFKLERMIRQGYHTHAEVEALCDALIQEKDTQDSRIYCAGYFPDSGELFFQNKYTCTACPPI